MRTAGQQALPKPQKQSRAHTCMYCPYLFPTAVPIPTGNLGPVHLSHLLINLSLLLIERGERLRVQRRKGLPEPGMLTDLRCRYPAAGLTQHNIPCGVSAVFVKVRMIHSLDLAKAISQCHNLPRDHLQSKGTSTIASIHVQPHLLSSSR